MTARAPVALGIVAVLLAVGSIGFTRVQGHRGSLTTLNVRLTAEHAGLPAGSESLAGSGEVVPPFVGSPPSVRRFRSRDPRIVRKPPPGLTPRLTAGGYAFPVYGRSSFVDTFGAPRADVPWHHGDDIFASLGAPVLAAADGMVLAVGWNDLGGNRLWLRDRRGNYFYYAHLSAFTPAARDGNEVTAGTVLGFVGSTGDAEGTPSHLHFEIHPVSRLHLGYDGAVNPTTSLLAWQRRRDVSFDLAEGRAPPATASAAPRPGAFLLQAAGISSASGLDPGSLEHAFEAPVPPP